VFGAQCRVTAKIFTVNKNIPIETPREKCLDNMFGHSETKSATDGLTGGRTLTTYTMHCNSVV